MCTYLLHIILQHFTLHLHSQLLILGKKSAVETQLWKKSFPGSPFCIWILLGTKLWITSKNHQSNLNFEKTHNPNNTGNVATGFTRMGRGFSGQYILHISPHLTKKPSVEVFCWNNRTWKSWDGLNENIRLFKPTKLIKFGLLMQRSHLSNEKPLLPSYPLQVLLHVVLIYLIPFTDS